MRLGNSKYWKSLAAATLLGGLAATAMPAEAKTLVIARDMDVNSLDLHRSWCDTCMIYNAAVYDGLLALDKDNKLVPVIAESWTVNGDQTVFTFKLNPKATFSDGSKVEAKDVKWSWERLKNIKGSPSYAHWLRAFVASYQMIYREPVVHEIPLVTQPTLFIMGADDHNAPGRPYAPEALRAKMGQNAENAKTLASQMKDGRAEVIPNTGHLVFLEAPEKYNALLLGFLGK